MSNAGQTSRSARDVDVPLGRRPAWRPAADMEVCPTRLLCILLIAVCANAQRFVILGDRTGEAQPGIYEAVWREIAEQKPDEAAKLLDRVIRDAPKDSEWTKAAQERLEKVKK